MLLSENRAWEGLSILVDGVVVKSAIIASFKEGVLAYWPPSIDEEILSLSNRIYLPNMGPGYSVIEYLGSMHKYVALVLGERVLMLQLDKRVEGENLGKRLLEVFSSAYLTLGPNNKELAQEEV